MKILEQRELKVVKRYRIVFISHEDGSGFSFPADKEGKILLSGLQDCALENYNYCMANKDKFPIEWNGFREYETLYMEPALAQCDCGEKFYLEDHYIGASQCPKCGSWYNLFGEPLLSPRYWED